MTELIESPEIAMGVLNPNGDVYDRLAAQWALRLVLVTPEGSQCLRSKNHTDDLLAVIGPWVDWPKSMKAMFAKQLAKLASDEWEFDEAKTFIDPMSVDRTAVINWHTVNWRELNGVFCALYTQQPSKIVRLLRDTLKKLEEQTLASQDPMITNLDRLSQVLKLSHVEEAVLTFYAVVGEHPGLRTFLRTIPFQSVFKVNTLLAGVLGLPFPQIQTTLAESSVLRRMGLITPIRPANDLEDVFKIDNELQRVLTERHDSLESLMSRFLESSRSGQLTPADYPHLTQAREDLSRLLSAALSQQTVGVNVLIYGPPGTGKTEFARMLASELDVELFAVKAGDQDGDVVNTQGRLTNYQLAQSFLRETPKAMLLFDEVEEVLGAVMETFGLSRFAQRSNSRVNSRKAWLNQVLETNPVPTIWISNSIEDFDPAFLRRFIYPVEISIPPRSVRRKIVEHHLGHFSLSEPCKDRLAGEIISPAQLDNLSRVINLVNPDTGNETEALLNRSLKASMSTLGQASAPAKNSVTQYQLDFLNIDSHIPLERLVSAAGRGQPLSMCLAGPPGTGKTQLAHYLAHQIDRPLLAKRASDVLDKWVGGTEQNLVRLFGEARSENAVLLLDEADSLLQNRAMAERSWEVTQVNELLQQMENFDGLFICTTNRFEHLDPASLRRFTVKLAFDYLTHRQRWRLFLQESGLSDDETYINLKPLRIRLDRLDALTPGDFATVKRQFIALGETPDAEGFVNQLEEEIRVKDIHGQRRAIGFVH